MFCMIYIYKYIYIYEVLKFIRTIANKLERSKYNLECSNIFALFWKRVREPILDFGELILILEFIQKSKGPRIAYPFLRRKKQGSCPTRY